MSLIPSLVQVKVVKMSKQLSAMPNQMSGMCRQRAHREGVSNSSGTVTVLEVGGADGLVRDMISWMARRSFRRCSGLLIPISLWISVSDSADMMAPLFTLARQAATYQAGMPTHSWPEGGRS